MIYITYLYPHIRYGISINNSTRGYVMDLWHLYFNDPIIFASFTGLGILLGIGAFFAVYFTYKINTATEEE